MYRKTYLYTLSWYTNSSIYMYTVTNFYRYVPSHRNKWIVYCLLSIVYSMVLHDGNPCFTFSRSMFQATVHNITDWSWWYGLAGVDLYTHSVSFDPQIWCDSRLGHSQVKQLVKATGRRPQTLIHRKYMTSDQHWAVAGQWWRWFDSSLMMYDIRTSSWTTWSRPSQTVHQSFQTTFHVAPSRPWVKCEL